MKRIEFKDGSKDIQSIMSLFESKRLNLEPGFQRKSVWTINDRKKLMQSILQNYPLPSIFLYRRTDAKGGLMYDVLDGKQRLESIFMFAGIGKFRRDKYEIKANIGDGDKDEVWNWTRLQRTGYEHMITGYPIQTIEVSGELSDIIDLFVRINSTGKRLTTQEKRHAQYYTSSFLKTAGQLAQKYQKFFTENRILSNGHIDRMKHVELIAELMASMHAEQLLNKKSALDKMISGDSISAKHLSAIRKDFIRTINIIKRVFPEFKTTRFSHSAEFYSLFMLLREYDKRRLILTDSKRNQQAQRMLIWLSNGVDAVRTKISKAEGAAADQRLFTDYLFTTRGDSDSSTTRTRRANILNQLFEGIFETKDEKRGFNKEQRRLIWNAETSKKCTSCGDELTWENFTIDHIKPHSLGGPSDLKNAALMCRSCNSKKGNRTKTARKTVKNVATKRKTIAKR